MEYDVIVIGAGAAGLMSAVSASKRKLHVLVLEHNKRAGLKILISGGGRCNFTNLVVNAEHFLSENPHFCKSALQQFTQNDFIDWIKKAHIEYFEKTLGQLFCKGSSKEILELLLKKLEHNGGDLKTDVVIESVVKEGAVFKLHTSQGAYQSKNLIVATGGLSYAKLGASDFGYRMAKQFGHKLTHLKPALDGFVLSDEDQKSFDGLAGVSCEMSLACKKRTFTEGVLFTHVGLSGPAVLKMSLYWTEGETVQIDFLPSIIDLKLWFDERRKNESVKNISTHLIQVLPKSLVERALALCKIKDQKLAEVSKADLDKLIEFLKSFRLIPKKTVGYEKAEVTAGGVDTAEISSKTMESKRVSGLFFVGEVLDVTGLLGGYNFQWAWSSGWVAGQSCH